MQKKSYSFKIDLTLTTYILALANFDCVVISCSLQFKTFYSLSFYQTVFRNVITVVETMLS